MTTSVTGDRASFEKAFPNPYGLTRCGDPAHYDEYASPYTQGTWEGWQAALRSQGKVEGWRPIVSAPMDGSQMLIWTHRLGFAVVTQDVDDPMPSSIDSLGHRFMVEDGKFGPYPIRGDYPEFWMPLPSVPTKDLTAIIGEGD